VGVELAELRTHQEDEVGLFAQVHPPCRKGDEAEGTVLREEASRAGAEEDGAAQVLRQELQLCPGAGVPHAASDIDRRDGGFREHGRRLLDQGPVWHLGLHQPVALGLLHRRLLLIDLGLHHVLRDVQVDGARPAAVGGADGLLDQLRDAAGL